MSLPLIFAGIYDNISRIKGDAYSLAVLLKYFGYAENLSFEDIMKIRKTFFNGKFYRENIK